MKKIKFFSLMGVISVPIFSAISCNMSNDKKIQEYNEQTELKQNVYSINENPIFKFSNFKEEKNIFIVKDSESFKEDILKQINENDKETVENNWNNFLTKYSKILDPKFLEKHHVIYYSNLQVKEESLDSVEIHSRNITINYITYDNPPIKSLSRSHYFILLNKNELLGIDGIKTNEIDTKEKFQKYQRELPKDNSVIYFK